MTTAQLAYWREVRAIRRRMQEVDDPLIALISGVNGIGKTTLSYELSRRLGIHQHVGLGTIVKTLREFGIPPEAPEMAQAMDNGFRLEEPALQLERQAEVIARVVNRLVGAYHAQHVHCVVEGVQLLPSHLRLPPGAVHLHLRIGDPEAYARRMRSANPLKYGSIDDETVDYLLNIDRVLEDAMSASSNAVLPDQRPTVRETAEDAVHSIYARYAKGGMGL
ncbi:MAG: hypothetical protein BIP78_0135 [Candidatus Bipolaricaulis sibiricus]|uniref:Uncharacterized protein n=1 Tax=Bipolaricaulis sibiricus TaxID=2501609 RepID=A0A410FS95_BIPS1|nr:MAG: hypothetical protein BIP78_0135 [Candidatus Bipolaricaulis sibiricus]